MITRFQAEIATALATLAFGLVIINGAREFGIGWDSSGPQPGAFPFYCGLLIAFASAGTIVATVGRRMGGSVALAGTFLDREQGKRVLAFFLPMVAFIVLSVTLGMYFAMIVYLIFAMRFQGRYGWLPSLATAFGTAAFFYFGLEKFAQVGLLKGPIETMLGL
ncbi:tripartite tricarboxylate transporter TctB family protein [Bosea sp. (in: a-proteobacteria)]|uniref:tripartite tricarboxylate transporter TctB family protein n=1 Tax=Bosea sp. (in: a-proteobacteria) TaxID=1871050 RepID=UPI002FC67669